MEQKAIIYLGGGGMSGVFGGGVMNALQAKNAYGKIGAMYGASVGVFNAAYFLTHNVPVGASIYFEDCQKGFIQSDKIWSAVRQRYRVRPLYTMHPDHYINAMHLDYLSHVITSVKKLDLEKLVAQPIPFYVKVFNQHDHKIEYLNIRSANTLKLLLAAASLPPYTFEYEIIQHKRLIDSCVAEVIGLDYLIKKYPDRKIVIILNRRPKKSLSNFVTCHLEALVGSWMYGRKYFNFPISRERKFRQEVEAARREKNILLVMPPENNPTIPGTLDVKKLKKTYRMGEAAAEEILEFIS